MYAIVKNGKVIGTSTVDPTAYLSLSGDTTVSEITGAEVGKLWNGTELSNDPDYYTQVELAWRDSELKSTDPYFLDDATISSSFRISLLTYRDLLRTYSTSQDFPFGTRPVRPTE